MCILWYAEVFTKSCRYFFIDPKSTAFVGLHMKTSLRKYSYKILTNTEPLVETWHIFTCNVLQRNVLILKDIHTLIFKKTCSSVLLYAMVADLQNATLQARRMNLYKKISSRLALDSSYKNCVMMKNEDTAKSDSSDSCPRMSTLLTMITDLLRRCKMNLNKSQTSFTV